VNAMSPFDEALAVGRAAWPEVGLAPEVFAAHLKMHARDGAPPPLEHAADLYLACACTHGSPQAVLALDALLVGAGARAVTRVDSSPAFIEDVLQAVREKLLLTRPPKIGDYAGRATLKSWLATTTVRTALNMKRRKDDIAGTQLRSSMGDQLAQEPELQYLRERYREPFEQAIRDSLAALSTKERALLRMHLGERMTVDRLGVVYRVSRATAARWLAAAREQLLERTHAHLRERLRLTPSELDSLGALVRSQLDVSVVRLLDGDDE
jgi:RNA polymerase sigma-70 factor (ECF subfamily)